jgi:hypothetical protein
LCAVYLFVLLFFVKIPWSRCQRHAIRDKHTVLSGVSEYLNHIISSSYWKFLLAYTLLLKQIHF